MEEDKARQSERKRGYNLLFTYQELLTTLPEKNKESGSEKI